MITASTIYWIGILDSVSTALTFLAVALFFLTLVSAIIWDVERDFNLERSCYVKKITLGMGAFFLILTFTNMLIPSTRLAAAMYLVPAVANSEDVKAIGDNSLEALRLLTEDWLRELAGTKADKKTGSL